MRKVLLIIAFFLSLTAFGQTENAPLKIIFCGDLMGHGGQVRAAETDDGYDYSPCFQFVQGYLKSADLAVVNLEVTLAGPPYSGYPQFSSPDQLLVDANKAGFGLFTTVNNHCMDSGKKGFLRTLDVFDSLNIAHLGTYRNEEERNTNHPLMMDLKGFHLAFLTYTYGTNEIPVPDSLVANIIDTIRMAADLEEARARGAEYVISMVHWGIEYQTTANAEQEALAKFLLDCGSDIVIGGHPHVVQNATMDALPDNETTPEIVVYSMGNLVSNQRDVNTDGGIMVELQLNHTENGIKQDVWYMPYWVYRGVYNDLYQYYILPSYDARQNTSKYNLDEDNKSKLELFDENTYQRLKGQIKECSFMWSDNEKVADTTDYNVSRF